MAEGSQQEQALQAKALIAGEAIADSQAPICIDLTYRSVISDTKKHLQGVLLPLGEPGQGMNMVLGGLKYFE